MYYKSFDTHREDFKPYGMTCERWIPQIMPRADRHNEIELNFIITGSLTYFFRDRTVTIPSGRIAVFWGLIPHKIVSYDNSGYYFVCTIPLSMFLKWRLSETFVSNIFAGEVLIDSSETPKNYDEYLFTMWEKDISTHTNHLASILEIRARLLRFEDNYTVLFRTSGSTSPNATKIERMTLFIAQNYSERLTAQGISDIAGVTPDYANTLFKKTFGHSLMKHVMIERINHAQRELIFTDDLVSQIAMDCGFSSISCFNSAFRNLNGCSPSEYRNRFRTNNML